MFRVPYRYVALLVGLAYVTGVAGVIRLALDPRAYPLATPAARAAWAVPWPVIAFVCLLMLGEAMVVLAALDPRLDAPLWRRGALGATALAVWAVPSTVVGVLHAPGYLTWHALWVWALAAVLVMSTASALAAAGLRRLGARRAIGSSGADA